MGKRRGTAHQSSLSAIYENEVVVVIIQYYLKPSVVSSTFLSFKKKGRFGVLNGY